MRVKHFINYLGLAFVLMIGSSSSFSWAEPFTFSKVDPVYTDPELVSLWNSISDIHYPNADDYKLIENYLKYGRRPYLDVLFSHLVFHGYVKREEIDRSDFCKSRLLQKTMLIGPNQEMPEFKRRLLGNVSEDDKSRCIILYSSYNGAYNSEKREWDNKQSYVDKLLNLVDELQEVGFKGHVLYHLGGYPLIKYGGLKLAHVPYSFKVMCFIEALLLGYDQVLWLDVAIHPTNNLEEVFKTIKNQGSLLINNGLALDYDYYYQIPILPDIAVAGAGVKVEELSSIPHLIATIIGLSFNHPKSHDLIREWYGMTLLTYPAMTLYPEEFLFSVACWKTSNTPSWGHCGHYFDCRSYVPVKPALAEKPFWFDKG